MTRGVSDLNMLAATIYPTVLTPLGADMGVFALSPHVSGEYVAELIPVLPLLLCGETWRIITMIAAMEDEYAFVIIC